MLVASKPENGLQAAKKQITLELEPILWPLDASLPPWPSRGASKPRNPRHFDAIEGGKLEGGRNCVLGGRTTKDTQSL